jgi:hypothetical protein
MLIRGARSRLSAPLLGFGLRGLFCPKALQQQVPSALEKPFSEPLSHRASLRSFGALTDVAADPKASYHSSSGRSGSAGKRKKAKRN